MYIVKSNGFRTIAVQKNKIQEVKFWNLQSKNDVKDKLTNIKSKDEYQYHCLMVPLKTFLPFKPPTLSPPPRMFILMDPNNSCFYIYKIVFIYILISKHCFSRWQSQKYDFADRRRKVIRERGYETHVTDFAYYLRDATYFFSSLRFKF